MCLAVLQYLAFRHDDSRDRAWPGLHRISMDLGVSKGRVVDAVSRLERDGFVKCIRSGRFGGASKSNQYVLPFVAAFRASHNPSLQFDWPPFGWSGSSDQTRSGGADQGRSGTPGQCEGSKVPWSGAANCSGRAQHGSLVGPPRPENRKLKNGLPPSSATSRTDGDPRAAREAALATVEKMRGHTP